MPDDRPRRWQDRVSDDVLPAASDRADDLDDAFDVDHDPADRRIVGRLPITRRCKIFEPISRRYIAASTRDLSPGGMRVRLDSTIRIEPGDRLFVGLSALGPSDLLRQSDLHESRVVWIDEASDGCTVVGLRLVEGGGEASETVLGGRRLAA